MSLTLPETGFVVLVDKPYGWTSFQVVNKTRWLLKKLTGIKKIKVGHAGTLDPLATGLMVLCVGKMTKQISLLTADEKEYQATGCFGRWSPSFDLEKRTIETHPTPNFNAKQFENCIEKFRGKQLQKAPIFSAKKIDGKRAYLSARAGEKVEIKANEIEIFYLNADASKWPNVNLHIHCSKGTYIRSLVNDLGACYGTNAVLTALRRTRSGNYKLSEAVKISELKAHLASKLTQG
ncbi:tRNA pseudouridine(55) synthase TruB [Luteibaculum oceani]|uniref:tRNA pseudouridine synthase B n=1 Tax=Luteibaculum oceani TaxID=1294296 RepID=A0A5C6VPH6_9FLAO|nr:tRNA pseudouridine(55) synthase TruB [Luteibaculum oceani]TXC85108.1 tRNA pseudouridine(55) synthase TruB [Luteibaculum oceani]